MFNKILLSTVALGALAGTAFAADLPSRRRRPGLHCAPGSHQFSPGPASMSVARSAMSSAIRTRLRRRVRASAWPPAGVSPNGIVGGAHVGYNFSHAVARLRQFRWLRWRRPRSRRRGRRRRLELQVELPDRRHRRREPPEHPGLGPRPSRRRLRPRAGIRHRRCRLRRSQQHLRVQRPQRLAVAHRASATRSAAASSTRFPTTGRCAASIATPTSARSPTRSAASTSAITRPTTESRAASATSSTPSCRRPSSRATESSHARPQAGHGYGRAPLFCLKRGRLVASLQRAS